MESWLIGFVAWKTAWQSIGAGSDFGVLM